MISSQETGYFLYKGEEGKICWKIQNQNFYKLLPPHFQAIYVTPFFIKYYKY